MTFEAQDSSNTVSAIAQEFESNLGLIPTEEIQKANSHLFQEFERE